MVDTYAGATGSDAAGDPAIMALIWDAIHHLTDGGLHTDDHVSRAQVLNAAVRRLTEARDAECILALAGGDSLADVANALGDIGRKAVHRRYGADAARLRGQALAPWETA